MRVLAVDPGLREAGCAVLDRGVLLDAWAAKNPETKQRGPAAWAAMAEAICDRCGHDVDVVVVEVPQIYTAVKTKGDPNDLIEIAGVVGATAMLMREADGCGISYFKPREWKGTVKKAVMTQRILMKLSAAEKLILGDFAQNHNVVDAVGIGKHAWAATRTAALVAAARNR